MPKVEKKRGAAGLLQLLRQNKIKAGRRVLVCPSKIENSPTSIDYYGTLREDGLIFCETDKSLFSSPSRWALHIVRKRNPSRIAVNGWTQVFYVALKSSVRTLLMNLRDCNCRAEYPTLSMENTTAVDKTNGETAATHIHRSVSLLDMMKDTKSGLNAGKRNLVCPQRGYDGVKKIDYFGSLLDDGVVFCETDKVRFSSVSAWAVHIRRKINQTRKAVNGWDHVFYIPSSNRRRRIKLKELRRISAGKSELHIIDDASLRTFRGRKLLHFALL